MTEGTREYKWLEGMLKELDLKKKKDMTRIKERLEKDLARVEGRFDAALEDIKILMNGMALQLNDLRTQRKSQEGLNNRGSILS